MIMLPAVVRSRHRGRQHADDLAPAEAVHQQFEGQQVQCRVAAMVDLQPLLLDQMADQFVGVLSDIQMGLAGDIGIAPFPDAKPAHAIQ